MGVRLRWVSNTGEYVCRMHTETQQEAVDAYDRWIEGKVIGEPQATEAYTVKELEAMGMRGVYIVEPEP